MKHNILTRTQAKELGLKYYFTGVPCKRGHIDLRFVSSLWCRQCANVATKKRRNSDGWNEYLKTDRAKYLDRIRHQRWRNVHYEQIKSKEDVRRKSLRAKNFKKLIQQKRRAIKSKVKNGFTKEEFEKIYIYQRICYLCKEKFSKVDPPTVDHVIPLALGGDHVASNIALAHRSCNTAKGKRRTHLI